MRRAVYSMSRVGALLVVLVTAAAGIGPVSAQSASGVLPADARALRYGASAPEIFGNPALGGKLRALFGADWSPSASLRAGAPAFFPASSALRMIRLGDQDYIAVTGCGAPSCASNRGLLLIRQDAEHLMARLDEGGFSHYYDYRTGAPAGRVPLPTIDYAWRAVEDLERG